MTDATPDPRSAALEEAAAGVLYDPSDAVAFVDLAEVDIDDDGNVDPRQAAWLIEKLAESRPHIVLPDARPAPARVTNFDAGARGSLPPPPPSVSEKLRDVARTKRERPLEMPAVLSDRFAPGSRPGADN